MANNFVDPKQYAGYHSDKMTFVQQDKELHDTKFETKPISYLRGCWNRFAKNKGSIVAGVILLLILSFAIIAPFTTSRTVDWNDPNYQFVLPKAPLFEGTGFWDGTEQKRVYETEYLIIANYETEDKPIRQLISEGQEKSLVPGEYDKYYVVRYDTYAVGAKQFSVSDSEYQSILDWESKHEGRKVLLPIVLSEPNADYPNSPDVRTFVEDYVDTLIAENKLIAASRANFINSIKNLYVNANRYYQVECVLNRGRATTTCRPSFDADGKIRDLYCVDDNGDYVYALNDTSSGAQKTIRVDYNVYYEYKYGAKCVYLFGASPIGHDIFVRLASGARLSLLLGVSVSLINLLIGLLWGSISGYYGGTVDLIMERVTDILSAIPFVIMATLFQLHLAPKAGPIPSLLFAFVVTGWIGTAATTRMQFYRFKNQEYVLASRTLGAKDLRLIFVDILPNAIGTLITSSVLMIPGVIFSESSLSYLNIIDLSNSNITSVGTLLNEGSSFLASYPHMVLFPAIFISILMISFNLIGNGLRDAFNPTLRGEE